MKKTLALVALMVLTGVSLAVAADQTSDWSASVDSKTKYVGGVTGILIVDGPVTQSSLTKKWDDYSVNVWASLHASDPTRLRKGDEIDVSGTRSRMFGSVRHDSSILYYDLYPLDRLRGDLFALRDVMTFPKVLGFTPMLLVEADIPQNKEVLPGGFMYVVGASRDVSIGGHRLGLNLAIGGHDGAYGLKPEPVSFARATVSLPIHFGSTIVTPSLMLQKGGREGGAAQNEAVLGLSGIWTW
jgi:hypothetical protein